MGRFFILAIFFVWGYGLRAEVLMLEEMVVTAQKREQYLIDVPISIVAISGDELSKRRITDFQDLDLAVPGLEIRDEGTFGRQLWMRGVGNGAGGNALVGVYLDELPVSTFAFRQLDLRTYDLERVEVLRGPQGTLFGQSSMGGTVRFITHEVELNRFDAGVNTTFAFTNDGDPSQELQAMLNFPVTDSLGLRIAATYDNSGGWMDQPFVGRDDINDQEVMNVRIKSLWKPVDELEISAMVIVHRNDAGAPSIGEDENGNYTQPFSEVSTPSTEDDYEILNLTINYTTEIFDFLSSTNYGNAKQVVNDRGVFFSFNGPPPEPERHSIQDFIYDQEFFSQEFRLTSATDGAWFWATGIFYQDSKSDDDSNIRFGIPNIFDVTFANIRHRTSESWAIFGNTSYAVTERLELGLGLRYFEDDKGEDGSTTAAPQSTIFDDFSQRIYATYHITDSVNLYASASKGFRSGGFNALGQPSVEPESVWTYELGTKMALLDYGVNIEAAVFYSDYSDYIISGIDPNAPQPIAIGRNAGDIEIKGVEWSLSWQATDYLTLGINGSYTDAVFDKLTVISASHIVGDRVNFIPKYTYAVSANYDFNWLGKSGFVRLDYSQQGRSIYRNRSNYPTYKSTSDVINMLNLNIAWQWSKNLSIGLFVENTLNENGFISAMSIEDRAARPRPRSAGFNINYDF